MTRTRAGYTLPGTSTEDIERAMKLLKLMKKDKTIKPPPEPKIKISPIKPNGGVDITFTQPMLAPKKGANLDQATYDSLMDIRTESYNDMTSFQGKFASSK